MNPVAVVTARARRRRPLPVLPVVLAALAVVHLAGCGGRKGNRSARVSVAVAKVVVRDVPLAILASGTVEPVQTADVGSQVGGVITSIPVREGQEVEAGQVLIQLDPRPFRAALEQARGVLARDLAQLKSAQADADRGAKMLEQNLIAPAENDKLVAAADGLRAAVKADSGAVQTARLNLEYAAIRAPFAGHAGHLNVHVGDLVKAGTSDPLVTVNQLKPIRVRFTVSQNDLPLVQRYKAQDPRVYVKLSPDDSTEIAGRLVFVDNAVDPSNGTLMLKGEFPNNDRRLWPGQFVEVRLVLTQQKGATVVPAPAVTNGQQGTYVYVLNPDSTTTARPVEVERSDDVTAVIRSGLKPGETVITDGQFRIGPGARVMVRESRQGARP